MRVSGQVVSDNQYIKHGAFHTLELEAPRKFTITKDLWDSIALQMVEEACNEKSTADLAAVVMEMGLAHVCLVTKSMSVTKAKIELSVPRKRPGSNQHEKQRDKFFEYVLQALVQHVDWSVVKAVIVASPGFVKDQFMEYFVAQVGKRELPMLAENKDRFVKARCSSGHKHSLKEVLQDNSIMEQLKVSFAFCLLLSLFLTPLSQDVKAATEVAALQRFYETFNTDASRAAYGLKHVQAADEAAAVDVLLLTNELFRVDDVAQRKVYVALTESVQAKGGSVHIFSTLHPSGEQLKGLTGVAAILRFPLDLAHVDQDLDESSSDSSSSSGGSSDSDSSSSDEEEQQMFNVLKGK
jgi:protein pelota